jgi:hypothetical protein
LLLALPASLRAEYRKALEKRGAAKAQLWLTLDP